MCLTCRQGVHFASVDDIPRGHRLHSACCGWSAGQDIQHRPPDKRRTAADFAGLTYRELIVEHYRRVRDVLGGPRNPWVPQLVQ